MRCPYCLGETKHRFCDYCGSEIPMDTIDLYRKLDDPQSYTNISVRNLCADYLEKEVLLNGSSEFFSLTRNSQGELERKYNKFNPRLLKILCIEDDQEIYLGSDTTILGTGKNGFAIATKGIYSKQLFENAILTRWETLANASEIRVDECGDVYVDNLNILFALLGDNFIIFEQLMKDIFKAVKANLIG